MNGEFSILRFFGHSWSGGNGISNPWRSARHVDLATYASRASVPVSVAGFDELRHTPLRPPT